MKKSYNTWVVIVNEVKFIFKDQGVILIMFGAIFIYSTLYSMAYHNQVVRGEPVAVIDMDNTTSSRNFISKMNSTPQINVKYNVTSLSKAEEMFYNKEIYGCFIVPRNFEKDILSSKQTFVSIYADAGYFLMYKQLFAATADVISDQNITIETAQFNAMGLSPTSAAAMAEPVALNTVTLYNRIDGYATFVMPALMILILQQVFMLSIGIIGGTFSEKKLYNRLVTPSGDRFGWLSITIGKAIVYIMFAAIIAVAVFGIYYKLFGYPSRGNMFDVVNFFIPYILSIVFMGMTIGAMCRYRETAILVLVIWSVPFLMFSGVSFPMEGIPNWFFNFGKMIPSSNAIIGFIKIEVMGASLEEITVQYKMLWILTAFYFCTALYSMKKSIK